MRIILNMTQGTFILVHGIKTSEYKYKVGELLTPAEHNSESHWDKRDKIVLVPKHLHNYVEKNYGQLY